MRRSTRSGLGSWVGVACSAVICGTVPSPASARNLPKAEPPPKVVACDGMGEGFVRVEGSETCLKLDGSVRAEFTRTSGGSLPSPGAR